jgi:hypothetical protein
VRTSFLLLSLLLPLSAQTDPAQQLEAAIHREVITGDLAGAITAYRALTSAPGTPRPVTARALLQLGQCREKLGQRREAHAIYTRLIRDFASEPEIATQAKTRLAGWTDALPGPRNLRFEEGEPGKVPPGWFVPTLERTTGSLAELHRKGCRAEGSCAVLIAPATAPGSSGNLMQSFSAAAYRSKTVRLRAWVRVEAGSPEDRAQLWLRIDRPSGKASFFDLEDRAIRPDNWTAGEIVAEIDADAQFLAFGVTATGRGRVWVDDVTFDVVPDEQITAARNAIRRQYASDTYISLFRYSGSEATATVRTVSVREGFVYIETFRDLWVRTGDGWRAGTRTPIASYFEAPDPDADNVKTIATELRQYATALSSVGPVISANCIAMHRPDMPRGAGESVLAAAGLPMFHLDVTRIPAESVLGQWLAEPHLLGGRPANFARSCTGVLFIEAAN